MPTEITVPALYVVNEGDLFDVAPDVHRKVFDRMGKIAEFKVINRVAQRRSRGTVGGWRGVSGATG